VQKLQIRHAHPLKGVGDDKSTVFTGFQVRFLRNLQYHFR
jgi:hypothetical protein